MTEIEKKASLFRKKYIHGKKTTRALCSALDEMGYTVVFFHTASNEPEVDVLIQRLDLLALVCTQRGFTFANDKYRLVFVNDDLSEEEKLVVLAHEIGHIYLRHVTRASIIGNDVIEEHEANEFSHYLLYKSNRALIIACVSIGIAVLAIIVVALTQRWFRGSTPVSEPSTEAASEANKETANTEDISSEKVEASEKSAASSTTVLPDGSTIVDNRGKKTKAEAYGVTFEIPLSWGSKKVSDDGHFTYYYPEDGMLMIAYDDFDDEGEGLTDEALDGLISGLSSNKSGSNFELISKELTTVKSDGRDAGMIEFYQTLQDMDLHLYFFCFLHDGKMISFSYADYPYASEDRTDTFMEILDSIGFDEERSSVETEEAAEKAVAAQEAVSKPAAETGKKKLLDSLTTSQSNAIKSAENYLNVTPFSKEGLINQLSSAYGDGYPAEDARFAVEYLEENGEIDWNEQAKASAQNYISMSPFSRTGLISQLSSAYGDQFTKEQAEYAVDYLEKNNLVDWNEQAAKSAKNYMELGSFSRAGLKEQLTSSYGDGFTAEQAEYALSVVGY